MEKETNSPKKKKNKKTRISKPNPAIYKMV